MSYSEKDERRFRPRRIGSGTLRRGLFSLVLLLPWLLSAQDPPTTSDPAIQPESNSDLFGRVIANQQSMEEALDEFERTHRVEMRKTGSDQKPYETRVWRLFPAGPAVTKLPIS